MQDLAQRTVQIQLYGLGAVFYPVRIGDKFARIMLEFFQPDTVFINFGFNIAVGRSGEGHRDWAGAAVAR